MIPRLSIVSLFLALLFTAPAGAAEPLVDAAWVKANIAGGGGGGGGGGAGGGD